ncbi:kinesin-domain-containing protein, partial [Fragilariopsis cylindrus CCMP1102]
MKVTSTQSPRASSSSSSSVQVIIRLRPLNEREKKYNTLPVVTASTLDKSVTAIKGKGKTKSKQIFQFDNVFTSFSTQEDIFEATLQPIIKDVLNGYESTVFAYGQTGTGKTHTMEGDLSNKDEYGVIPRSASAIFNELQSNPDYISSSVYCSLLEIYNEELSDLLVTSIKTTTTTKLAIMEGENGPFCRGLSETKVTCAEELLVLMQRAHEQRHTGETDMNKESSRSHCIFTLRIESKRKLMDGSILEIGGKLHCVDLAGSECAKSCGNAGPQQATRERERMNINRSLLTLGRVVKLLKDAAATGSGKSSSSSVRIPYRDSKLTRILQESLGGRCKTCLIATISPSITAIEESMSTLNYAQAANGIINKP